jgi:hypothetical protein
VEPGYTTFYPPLGLMRISTWHKKKGDKVDFVKEKAMADYFGFNSLKLKKRYDVIYITSLFTYHYTEVISCIKKYQHLYQDAQIKVGGVMATLLYNLIERETGITPHIGLLMEAEEYPPDYSLFPNLGCSITFTSRGCVKRCKYCVVPTIEPRFFLREDWNKDIHPTHEKIIFWDNNWLASPNFYKDVEKLRNIGKPYDFNQGLDCRLFDKKKANLLYQTKIYPLRFAFDSPAQEGYIQKAIQIAKKVGFSDIRVYVLYNSPEEYDTPAYFHYRVNELNKLGASVYPMRYRPIKSICHHWISPRWDKEILRGLKLTLIFFYKGGIIKKGREGFLQMLGRNAKEFEQKMKEINAYDRALWKKKKMKK